MIPLILVEGPDEQFDHAVHDVVAAGWAVRPGWSVTRGVPEVQVGAVTDASGATEAIGAVLAGSGVVVHGRASRPVLDALGDDLRRFGRLDHRIGASRVPVSDEERELLRLLTSGASVASAARELFLSRRSVERRLAGLRQRFAVQTQLDLLAAFLDQSASVIPAP